MVRVRGYGIDPKKPKEGEKEMSVGSGVVILENGTILTNLHVVQGADRIMVTFYDGLEATAMITGDADVVCLVWTPRPRSALVIAGWPSASTPATPWSSAATDIFM